MGRVFLAPIIIKSYDSIVSAYECVCLEYYSLCELKCEVEVVCFLWVSTDFQAIFNFGALKVHRFLVVLFRV